MEPDQLPEQTEPPIETPVEQPAPPPAFSATLRIIFRKENGGVAVVMPIPDCGLSLEQVIAQVVPAGAPYRVVEADTIPTDRTFRAAWEWID